jgi:hypothetical protein
MFLNEEDRAASTALKTSKYRYDIKSFGAATKLALM